MGAHEVNQKRGRSEQNASYQQAGAYNQEAGAGKNTVCFLFLFFAQADRYGDGRAYADKVCKRKIYNNKGHGQIERGKGRAAKELAHKDAVQRLIQR